MLSLDVCDKCRLANLVEGLTPSIWEELDKEYVKGRGYIVCWGVRKRNSISDPPPEYCQYKFEHAVAEAMKNE